MPGPTFILLWPYLPWRPVLFSRYDAELYFSRFWIFSSINSKRKTYLAEKIRRLIRFLHRVLSKPLLWIYHAIGHDEAKASHKLSPLMSLKRLWRLCLCIHHQMARLLNMLSGLGRLVTSKKAPTLPRFFSDNSHITFQNKGFVDRSSHAHSSSMLSTSKNTRVDSSLTPQAGNVILHFLVNRLTKWQHDFCHLLPMNLVGKAQAAITLQRPATTLIRNLVPITSNALTTGRILHSTK